MDEEALSIPDVLFNFRPIADIGTVEAGAILDVIGVVESVENWQTLTRKTGEETRKRALVLRDSSGGSIELTLWGQAVSDPGESLYTMVQAGQRPILAVKNARVGDFNGKTLGTVGSSTLKVQPEIQEAMHLAQWYSAGGASVQAQALSGVSKGGMMGDRRCTLSAIKDEDLGHGEKPDYIVVHATINYVKSDSFPGYASCPGDFNGRLCQKKLTEGGGQWYCERCSKYYSEPVWRYIVSIQASDHTAQSWLTCFGDAGELLMNGVKAPELKQMEMENLQEYEKMMMDANLNRMVFKLKVAEESYNDEVRVKVSVTKLEHMDYIKESRATLDLIHKLEAGVPIFQPKSLEAMPGSTTSIHHSHHAFQQPQNLHGGGGMQFAGNGASPGPYSMGQQGTAGYQQHGGSSVSTATYQAGHMGHPMQQHTSSTYGARQPQFEDQVVSHQPYGVNNAQNSIRHMQGGVMGVAPSGPPAYLQHQRYDASGPQQHSLHGGMPQGRDTADYGHDIGRPMGVSHPGPPGSGMPGYDGSGASYLSRAPQQDLGNNFPSGGFNMPGNAATDHSGLPAQQTAGAYGTYVSGQQPQQRGSVPPFW
ncbi:hypothetical protein CEUSTIGMA_g2319.t1 [Chlamydomonas eustigma]|uniref:SAC domain-containing protein n=1 Tax=Chlamydomonas eustigma TaxID=1157962 RepID=A0A250WVK1_9CHLO|nr:hypothetical protein CEUSTIGMA_g2319.t1 [Chlamydomonas eustigma]|eukprot:GAX74873.1 hypothetical protein CEUSTIGMA_g2319.t1 [Chlamydomonas eustigma]